MTDIVFMLPFTMGSCLCINLFFPNKTGGALLLCTLTVTRNVFFGGGEGGGIVTFLFFL